MKLKSILKNEKFTLEVTMPQSIEFVDAVLQGGAQALKMRCNNVAVGPLSAGIFNGPFQTRKAFLKEVVELAGDVPVGLVPGGPESFITEEERDEAEEIGIDYFICTPMCLPCYMMDSKKMDSVLCTTYDNRDEALYRALDMDPKVDVVEANFLPHEEFGRRLYYQDILEYRSIVRTIHKPIIATAEKHVRLEEVRYLYEAGVKSLMIGVSLFNAAQEENGGGKLTPETCKRVTAQFREAIERL